ncbi:hypothetical protein GCM10018987_51890 [Streptomyces cremeus]
MGTGKAGMTLLWEWVMRREEKGGAGAGGTAPGVEGRSTGGAPLARGRLCGQRAAAPPLVRTVSHSAGARPEVARARRDMPRAAAPRNRVTTDGEG